MYFRQVQSYFGANTVVLSENTPELVANKTICGANMAVIWENRAVFRAHTDILRAYKVVFGEYKNIAWANTVVFEANTAASVSGSLVVFSIPHLLTKAI